MTNRMVVPRWKFAYQLSLPALAIGLAYAIFVGRPLAYKLADVQAQVAKSAASNSRGSPSQQLSSAKALEQQLQKELAQLQVVQQRLTTQPDVSGLSPVNRMAETLALLQASNLKCLESTQLVEEDGRAGVDSVGRSQKIRIRLTGTFEQMRQALERLQAAPSCASLLSLTMEPCASPNDATHQWILIILV